MPRRNRHVLDFPTCHAMTSAPKGTASSPSGCSPRATYRTPSSASSAAARTPAPAATCLPPPPASPARWHLTSRRSWTIQVGDLRQEAERLTTADDPPRSDLFATHPFSPLRLKAVELFAASEMVQPGGLSRLDLEMQVQELVTLMDPSYLQDRSDVAEAMRRLLFAGGVAVATASGSVTAESVKALERLLGVGSVPSALKPDVIRADLPSRIDAVNRIVPPLRRAQVIRDLCVIARADARIDEAELTVIREIARAVNVDETVITGSTRPSPTGSCSACA